jgi:uncharacterized protein (DUF362 family)
MGQGSHSRGSRSRSDCPSRREFLRKSLAGAAGLAGLYGLGRPALRAEGEPAGTPRDILAVPDRSLLAPTSPVGIVRCRTYELETLRKALADSFDLIGGIETLVKGKTVTVKLNTTGNGRQKMCGLPSERTYQVHPAMVEALAGLLSHAGARRIVLVESFYENRKPEEILGRQGWAIERILKAGEGRVVFADTRNRGDFKDYAALKVPHGGYVFPQYQLNRHYVDTDVFISLAKLKNHITAGITCSVKNLFGIAPTSLYGNDAPNERTTENRGAILHDGKRTVPEGVVAEIYTDTPRVGYYRVPRVTADLFSIRPVDLAIVDGVESVFGGEGPWCPPPLRATRPGVIMSGKNGVTTDAVAVGVMGYDPQAKYGERPFPGENHLNLLARAGAGTNDLARIEVRGLSLREALHEYEPELKTPGWVRRHLGAEKG